ncbi:MAG: DUF4846 domain-containing protein [Butyribacter sp.]|nr:DUF4846 domain-containing protein [bacterium]MDY3854812.1 DUF4846 domain-containing protein [Butyribacter sp.]
MRKMKNMKKIAMTIIVAVLLIGTVLVFYNKDRQLFRQAGRENDSDHTESASSKQEKKGQSEEKAEETEYVYISAEGKTLEQRINVPEGYTRTEEKDDSLGTFLRTYKLKKDGSPVLLYDGTEKGNQNAHAAIFKLPIEKEDLQQCADSVMRVFGEYYYSKGDYQKIQFTLGGGFVANFSKWSQGYGISVSGDNLVWNSSTANDTSYASFQKFMRMVFAYSGTMNLEEDSKKITLDEIQIGDIFIKGGSPGHVVMVVDLCTDENGKKAFLLAQGYMPAQEFHVIKNPLHEENPWYYQEEIQYPLHTAEYTFDKGALRRLDIAR